MTVYFRIIKRAGVLIKQLGSAKDRNVASARP